MALQTSAAADNAMLDGFETGLSASPVLKIRTGSAPANCAAADSGTVLATLALPADAFAAASSRSKALSGTWTDASADASGTAGHFRLYLNDGTTCYAQGSVTVTAGGGIMTVDSTAFTAGQGFTITAFTLAMNNA